MPTFSSPLEPVVYRIGEQLARFSAGRTPTLFEGRWWLQTAFNLAWDSRFKTQLFRFIDVPPSVTTTSR
jgi:RHH-type proline utilization regulon transcriptional repressor/proline dehydrogenase/delta 1-pyrroline-5-carboxylate dehydrogenase